MKHGVLIFQMFFGVSHNLLFLTYGAFEELGMICIKRIKNSSLIPQYYYESADHNSLRYVFIEKLGISCKLVPVPVLILENQRQSCET